MNAEDIVKQVALEPCKYKGRCNSTRCMPCAAQKFLRENLVVEPKNVEEEISNELKMFESQAEYYLDMFCDAWEEGMERGRLWKAIQLLPKALPAIQKVLRLHKEKTNE